MTGTRKMIATLSLTLVAYAAAALSTLVVAEERWVEGQHYQTLTPPVAVGRGSDVVVTEFLLVRVRPLLHLRAHADRLGKATSGGCGVTALARGVE